MRYSGQCHCGAIRFHFESEPIEEGLRCNCSVCRRKGAVMTTFALTPAALKVEDPNNLLSTYIFGSATARHHFCSRCGIYTFHQTRRQPGHYRVNLGCIDALDSLALPTTVFDGAALSSE